MLPVLPTGLTDTAPMRLTPDSAVFCLLSFEGPDPYALAGGLGVRISNLADALAERGFDTHLLFVGDPELPGRETRPGGRLTLHRWCQWISAYHPTGVYAGEEDKLRDFNASVPPFLVHEVIRPALERGQVPVILAEEWHTAEAVCRLHGLLEQAGLRGRTVVFWNANNVTSFHRVDWRRLTASAQLTTVSRYMKHLMWQTGTNPLVIPNGVPAELLEPVPPDRAAALRDLVDPDGDAILLFKVGRFDPAKRWSMAVEAAARLKAGGRRVAFPVIGGIEPYGAEVMDRARHLGLHVTDVDGKPESWEALTRLLLAAPPADVYNLRFFLSQDLLRPFYRAADAVLANSGHEPFGLVGLEAMAAGGLVFTGGTGEEYAFSSCGAISLDTDDPEEITSHVLALQEDPDRADTLRQAARLQAARFTWDEVSRLLLDKVAFAAHRQGVPAGHVAPTRRVRDVVVYVVAHQPRRLRLPARTLPGVSAPDDLARALFDERLDETYFRRVAASCYAPAVDRLLRMTERGFRVCLGFSHSFLDQAARWAPGLLDGFRRLASHDHVDLAAVEPTRSFFLERDVVRLAARMRYAADRLTRTFGKPPVVADATGFRMTDALYHALDEAGFAGILARVGREVLAWREPTFLYHHADGHAKLLVRHDALSDDVGLRFQDRTWPLTAGTYASWIAGAPGDVAVLAWDLETFGERHGRSSGIFDFLAALPDAAWRTDLYFATPAEALERHGADSYALPLPSPARPGARTEHFPEDDTRQAVYRSMVRAYERALRTAQPALIDLALWMAQADILHMLPHTASVDPAVFAHAPFVPSEWCSLGPSGVLRETKRIYARFLDALDAPRAPRPAVDPERAVGRVRHEKPTAHPAPVGAAVPG